MTIEEIAVTLLCTLPLAIIALFGWLCERAPYEPGHGPDDRGRSYYE